ncbi:hypothetical protein LJC17_01235 [Acholeplasma sp. OttesenSCG-928-E16]|nr:hypothetical protein [Acholeplasma sp. OttesenSCG-928-E16]
MKSERMMILELLQAKEITPEEAEKLLRAVDESKKEDENQGSTDITLIKEKKAPKRKMIKIIVNSTDGDNVNIQIPIEFAKLLKTMNLDKQMSDQDININIDDIIKMVDEGAIGELVNIKTADGTLVKIVIE